MVDAIPHLAPAARLVGPPTTEAIPAGISIHDGVQPVLPGGQTSHVVVVGGGIAGLAAAYRLTRLDPPVVVTLVDAEPRLGGKILTEHVDGFTIEGGPDSFLSVKPRGVGLCAELGIAGRLRGTMPRPHRAFVRRGDRLHELPEGLTGLVPTRLRPMLGSGLLSPWDKVRFAADYILPPRRTAGDESLAAFVRRRLGGGVYDHLVEPLMAGIYAGDGEQLSLASTFPHLRAGELAHGGLIRGVLATRRNAAGGPSARPPFVTPEDGLGELVEALADRLHDAGVAVRLGLPVTTIGREEASGTYRLRLASGEAIAAGAVVVATPADVTATLLAPLDTDLGATLGAIPMASTGIVTLAYPVASILRPLDAHGYVIPRSERRPALACTWTSAKWHRRAPDGIALLRVFIGRYGQADPLAQDDETLLALARDEAGSTLGVSAPPTLTRVHRWPHGMPQYTLGHLDRLATIDDRLTAHPGLALAGNAYRGVGLPDCIASGETAATVVHTWLHQRAGSLR